LFPFAKIAWSILMVIPSVIFNPAFWIIILLVSMQYARTSRLEEKMFGQVITTPGRETLESALHGLVGGALGSFIFVFVGVTVGGAGLSYIWPLALLLMLVEPRFLCFSYAGGIVSLTSLLFGFPKVGIPELMSLVAVLHMIESLLIWTSGHTRAVPVFIKDKWGRVLGGFSLQKFWPIPVIAMTVVTPELPWLKELTRGLIKMPEWWPLIKPEISLPPGKELIYMMFAIPAALGYGDIALTRKPAERSKATAYHLMIFSLVLLTLAVLSARYDLIKPLAALFAPLGHEAVIRAGRQMEFEGEPIFVRPPRGVKVLDVVPGSPAAKAGLSCGDVILAVNGREVNSKGDIHSVLEYMPSYICLDVERQTKGGHLENLSLSIPGNVRKLGIVAVPEPGEQFYMELKSEPFLARLRRWLKRE